MYDHPMERNRKTSVYTLTAIVSTPGMAVDSLKFALKQRRPAVELSGSRVDGDQAVVQYRVGGGDAVAVAIAEQLLGRLPDVTSATLHTGLGVNKRIVATI